MNITQMFYDQLASRYDQLFQNWEEATCEQAGILHRLIAGHGYDRRAKVLDCACGIGTQAIGLARLGYSVTASDISDGALDEARKRAEEAGLRICFEHADFCSLSDVFAEQFEIVMAMDNALPHMLSAQELGRAIRSIANRLKDNGLFIGSIRDYDALLQTKPPYSPPYIHKTRDGQRVSFQTWQWEGEHYRLMQYIIDDGAELTVSKFACEYRATRREEITRLFLACGCREVKWLFPEETDFYQPIVIARK